MEEIINALFDKFTVRSENFEGTLRFLAALTMTRLTQTGKGDHNKPIWKYEWLEWVLEICLFENLIPERSNVLFIFYLFIYFNFINYMLIKKNLKYL